MAFAALAAVALAVSAVGPCHCLPSTASCHRQAPEADVHACCEKPAGVQGVSDDCCDDTPELVLAATDVPEVAPPELHGGHVATMPTIALATPVGANHVPPPHPPDRTTVLLI